VKSDGFFGRESWAKYSSFLVDEIANLLPNFGWYSSILDENTLFWMNE